MSDKQKAALEALATLPQDKRDQALQGMEFISIGYQMGKADGLKEAEENGKAES